MITETFKNRLTLLPHVCACLKLGPGFPTSYVMVFLCVQWVEVRGDCSFCWYWWHCWTSLFKLVFHNVFRKTTYTLFKRTPRLSPANVSILLLAKSNVSIEGSVTEGKYGMMFCPRFNILNEVKPSKDPSSISCIWLSWKSLKHK